MEQLKQEQRDYLYFDTTDARFKHENGEDYTKMLWINAYKKTFRHERKMDMINSIIGEYHDCFYFRFAEHETFDEFSDDKLGFFDLDLYFIDLMELYTESHIPSGLRIDHILTKVLNFSKDDARKIRNSENRDGWIPVFKKMIEPDALKKYIKEATVDNVTPWDGYGNGESESVT